MNVMQIFENPILTLVPAVILYLFAAYMAFKILDFTTGLLKTWKKVHAFKSSIMRDGLIRWISELIAITFVVILDLLFGLNWYLTGFTVSLFVYKEGGSIAENLSALGVEMPGIVKDTLNSKLKGDDKK